MLGFSQSSTVCYSQKIKKKTNTTVTRVQTSFIDCSEIQLYYLHAFPSDHRLAVFSFPRLISLSTHSSKRSLTTRNFWTPTRKKRKKAFLLVSHEFSEWGQKSKWPLTALTVNKVVLYKYCIECCTFSVTWQAQRCVHPRDGFSNYKKRDSST